MIAIACILLAISGVVLMLSLGVGPFAHEPWEEYYFAFKKRPKWLQTTIQFTASIVAAAMTLLIIGGAP